MTGVAALLNPRSIAVVGATPRADSLGGRPMLNLAAQGYRGRVYPVNPRYEAIGDARCYARLTDLPEPPDAVLLVIAMERVFETLDQAVEAGAKSAIVFGGGFAETGQEGAARQAQLRGYAARGLRIAGPNVNGLFNVAAGIAMGFSPSFEQTARKGRVSLISQSGAIATGVSSRGMETGVGFSHVIATGNEADLEVSDYLEHLVDDPDVGAFACFIESLKDPARFLRAARAALEAGKPIVALKAGRSAEGQAASMSHTGAMTGSYEVQAGALRQAGVVVVETLDAMLAAAAVFGTGHRPRPGCGTAVMSLSGGMASLIADQCSEAGVPLATFSEPTQAALRSALAGYATVSNPLDVTGQVVGDEGLWTACATAIAADPAVDSGVAILSILAGHTDRRVAKDMVEAGGSLLQIGVWASAAPPGCGIEALREAGVPCFLRSDDAVGALSAWRGYWGRREARLAGELPALPALTDADPWALLEAAGIPIARQALVADRAGLGAALARLRPPLALKIQSDDIPHKTELGLLRLGMGREQAEAAFDALMEGARVRAPGARIDGVLVQEMAPGKRELILGMRQEAGLGPAVVLGIGGIFSEVMRDISVRPAPLSALDAAEMLAELRGRALLGPVRGLGAARPGMIEEVLQRFAGLAAAVAGRFREFEVNPLILADDGQSCTAVDVLAG